MYTPRVSRVTSCHVSGAEFDHIITEDRLILIAGLADAYGVASISRLLQITGFFCRIWSLLQGSFAKETYNFREPTNRSHPITLQFVRGLLSYNEIRLGLRKLMFLHELTFSTETRISKSDNATTSSRRIRTPNHRG